MYEGVTGPAVCGYLMPQWGGEAVECRVGVCGGGDGTNGITVSRELSRLATLILVGLYLLYLCTVWLLVGLCLAQNL